MRAFADRLQVANEAKKTLGNEPGLVICPDYSGPIWLKRFKQPLLVQLHGAGTLNALRQGKRVTRKDRWFEKNTLQSADAIQAYSHFTACHTSELFGLKRTPVWIIPHPIDPQQFYPDPSAVKSCEILFVGKLNTLKGVFALAQAITEVFRGNEQATLVVVGGDHQEAGTSAREHFLSLIPSVFHHRVSLPGHLSRSEVAGLMRRAGVFILPSYIESFGLVVLEAMASGRPVVASARGAIPEIVRNGATGLLADPEHPSTFAWALLTLLNNSDRANKMGEAGRDIVLGEYTPQRVYRRIEGFHKLLMNGAVTPSTRH